MTDYAVANPDDIAAPIYRAGFAMIAEVLLEAMHDRDGLQAERDAWREECVRLTAEALR